MSDDPRSTIEPWQRVLFDHLANGYSIIQGFDDEDSASAQEQTRYWAELETCRENGRSSGDVSGPAGESYESHIDAIQDLAKQLGQR